jgi:hypothetical protein
MPFMGIIARSSVRDAGEKNIYELVRSAMI